MNAEDERRAVVEIAERLSTRFPQAAPTRISAVVEQAHDELDGRPIRDFVPILVEREASERLAHPV